MLRDWNRIFDDGILNRVIRTLSAAGDVEQVYAVPDNILIKLDEQLREGDDSAGYPLLEVGTAALELGDWQKAVWMKRAGEFSLRTGERSYHTYASQSLEPFVSAAIREKYAELKTLGENEFQNPVDILAAISYEPISEDDDTLCVGHPFLPGCFYATGHRFNATSIVRPHELFQYILPASFEVELYMRHGFWRDAEDVIRWIVATVPLDVEPELDIERKLARNAFARCGHAFYRHTENIDQAEAFYQAAVSVGRCAGDELAPDLFYLADIAIQQGLWKEGLERLHRILALPDVTDTTLLKLTKVFVKQVEGELTGEPRDALDLDESIRGSDLFQSSKASKRWQSGAEPTASIIPKRRKATENSETVTSKEFDVEAVFKTLAHLAKQTQHGIFIEPFELDAAVGQFLQAHKWLCDMLESEFVDAEFLTTSAKMILRFSHRGLFIKRLGELEKIYERTKKRISEDDVRHVALLIAELERFRNRLDVTKPAESPPPSVSSAYEDGGVTAAKRIEFFKSQLALGLPWLFAEDDDEKPPVDLSIELPSAVSDLKLLFAKRITPDGVKPVAANLLQLAEFVVAHFLRQHGLTSLAMRRHIDPDYRPLLQFSEDIESNESTNALYRFLQHTSAWIGSGYREQILADALKEQGEQSLNDDFLKSCDDLVDCLNADRDFLFYSEMESGSNRTGEVIRKLVIARNLCISNCDWTPVSEVEHASDMSGIPAGNTVAFLINVPMEQTGLRDQLTAFLAFSTSGLKIYLSSHASRRWWNVYLANRDYRGAIRETLRLHEGKEISKTIASYEPTCFTDLTRMNTPLSATDPDGPIVVDSRMPDGRQLPSYPVVQLWSPYLKCNEMQIDDSNRIVHFEERALGPHPELPDNLFDSTPNDRRLLAFPAYERWSLNDLAEEGLCNVTLPEIVDRDSFLSNDWGAYDILHLSTHGEAFAQVPDTGNISLGCHTEPAPPRIHYNDILRLDLSSVSLVVLNVCMSKYGVQWANDEDLSLAWAFRASGANSVIASRWNVPDAAAWYFAHWLYDALLRKQQPVRDAFRSAVRNVRIYEDFKTPDIWGTFSLLD